MKWRKWPEEKPNRIGDYFVREIDDDENLNG